MQRVARVHSRIPNPLESVKAADARGLPRWAELLIAFAGLILTTPLIALSGIAIALSSGFPILFRQTRVGKDGRNFELYKLRTMRPSAGGPLITSGADARITRLGNFLRHTKLDELPAIWNVLRGEMSLVGPRPEVPRFVNLDDPTWRKVLSVRPGITDPVSVHLRSEADLLAQVAGDTEQFYVNELQPAKLQGYLAYLEERSWSSDLKILLRTFVAVVKPAKVTPLLTANQRDSAPAPDDLNEGH